MGLLSREVIIVIVSQMCYIGAIYCALFLLSLYIILYFLSVMAELSQALDCDTANSTSINQNFVFPADTSVIEEFAKKFQKQNDEVKIFVKLLSSSAIVPERKVKKISFFM